MDSSVTSQKLVKYGLQITVQEPIVDWTNLTAASIRVSKPSKYVDASNTGKTILMSSKGKGEASIAVSAKGNSVNSVILETIEGSEAKFFIHYDSDSFVNFKEDLVLTAKANSKTTLLLVQHLQTDSAGFFDVVVDVHKNAEVNIICFDGSGKFIQRSIVANLLGEGAKCTQKVLSLCSNQQHDLYTESHHGAARTQSNILTRTAVFEHGKSISRSLVRIASNAYGSEGYEKQEALILSDSGEADAIPNLEIHNHDVKCSHGSTIGRLDEEKIYYLTSRGLSQKQAIGLLIEGFYAPIIASIPDKNVCMLVESCIRKLFGEE